MRAHLPRARLLSALLGLNQLDPDAGKRARQVKVDGWLNAVGLCKNTLKVAVGIGSWAGSFGNRILRSG